MKNQNTLNNNLGSKVYQYVSYFFVLVMAFLFTFPLFWIISGAFKTGARSTPGSLPGGPVSGS